MKKRLYETDKWIAFYIAQQSIRLPESSLMTFGPYYVAVTFAPGDAETWK